ncbi:MAG: EMC3/TMCO1 family protein [Candidatus Nanohaloarchaea archaeon]
MPILQAGQYISLAFFSAVLAAIFSGIRWYLLDIEKANELKDKLNHHQEKMKEAQKENESEKVSTHLQKTLHLNQKFMKLNLKPMIGVMVFVSLIFPWLGATYAPKVKLNKTSNNTFKGELSYAGQTTPLKVTTDNQTTLTINNQTVKKGEKIHALGVKWEFAKFNAKKPVAKLSSVFIQLPFSVFYIGNAINWLGFYIIIAMPLSSGLSKALGVV